MEKGIRIPKSEFEARIQNLKGEMQRRQLDAIFVYGDEYRKENLRYVSNYWPLFERGECCAPRRGSRWFCARRRGRRSAGR